MIILCVILSTTFIWLSHQNIVLFDTEIFTGATIGTNEVDSVEQEYEAAVKRQNIKINSPLNEQNDDDDNVGGDSSGVIESKRNIVKKDILKKDNDELMKNNSSIYVTAGIESYDSQDDASDLNQNDPRRMNVIILFPDDWRHDSIGSENPIIQTPYLDSLAKEGIRFRQNAVTTSICWQSRATLFSGQWASRHRSFKLRCPHFTVGKAWNNSWPAILRRNGYFVGHIGKWQYHNSDAGSRFDWGSFFEGECRFLCPYYRFCSPRCTLIHPYSWTTIYSTQPY
jgi:hypothetical protein